MKTKRLWICLIGSAFIHIAVFVSVAKMSPSTHVSMREIETFIVDHPAQQLSVQKRGIRSGTEINNNRLIPEVNQPQTVHEDKSSHSPQANQINTEVSPSKALPVPATVKSAQSASSVTALNKTQINLTPVHSNEDSSGNKLSNPIHQDSGTGHIMALGEVGSPRFIHRELPKYPFMARKLGKEGKVILRLTLDAQGQLQAVETVEANGFGFAEAASAAIRMSTYSPAVKNGRAVSSQVLVPVKFVLQESQ